MSSTKHTNGLSRDPQPRGPPPNIQPRPKLSKAERRDLQEKQKAAKAAAASSTNAKDKPKEVEKTLAVPDKKSESRSKPSAVRSIARINQPSPSKDSASVESAETEHVLRDLRIFSHFGFTSKIGSSATSTKADIHPSILRLALQFAEFRIVGANARCISTLTALKTVIQDYATPPQTTLSRHLMTHLSPQITHLVAARPMSTSMGNAIRYLKYEISILDIDLPEQDAKQFLCERLDHYVRDRIILADLVIQDLAIEKIHDGDAILTYARSSVVEKVLVQAHQAAKDFSVIIVDSGPLFEGKRLLASLRRTGIKCTYCLLSALGAVIPSVSLVFLGAHALHANGALYSRAGTALVSMMAKQHSVPVLACCETYKFSNVVPFDGFTKNELAPEDGFESRPFLQSLSPLYDLTPSEAVSAVVTEVGLIPPSSVPTILFRAGVQE
ncbi:hypothetical protein BS47DRAFT_1338290 [Hydnum rufescens UP504]|uniref:Translation initiation factor eIF2B subunit delta n=1 Tax=Hydnum rufescens UP504 TaxID=1448309 RepID=A0A9P6B6D4_9AGAM|nr:hypothetical protein BS47DRAFT_1338290 [Hydnum rufescens UP504]